MGKKLLLDLPNGTVCHYTSPAMRIVAKYLRWEIFTREQYRKPGFELRTDDTVVDVGAHIGMFALWTSEQIPQGRLICIEPNPLALECLRINLERNALKSVSVVPAAIGAGSGKMELVSHPGWEAMGCSVRVNAPWLFNGSWAGRIMRSVVQTFALHASSADERRVTVPVWPLAQILREHNIATVNLLKVDCEGGEFELLRSLNGSDWARIERVVLEYHDLGPGYNHRELVDILRRNGFTAEVETTLLGKLFALFGVKIGLIWAARPISAHRGPLPRPIGRGFF
jgi:FkbM family methyltransferase